VPSGVSQIFTRASASLRIKVGSKPTRLSAHSSASPHAGDNTGAVDKERSAFLWGSYSLTAMEGAEAQASAGMAWHTDAHACCPACFTSRGCDAIKNIPIDVILRCADETKYLRSFVGSSQLHATSWYALEFSYLYTVHRAYMCTARVNARRDDFYALNEILRYHAQR
jgi:hypothetical protein